MPVKHGCCSVHLGAATPRGTDRDVYLNGERGTYASFAKRLGSTTTLGIYHRVQNRCCLRETGAEIAARRVKRRVQRARGGPSGLVNRFLRAMSAPVSR